jgi:hypothetical protein
MVIRISACEMNGAVMWRTASSRSSSKSANLPFCPLGSLPWLTSLPFNFYHP